MKLRPFAFACLALATLPARAADPAPESAEPPPATTLDTIEVNAKAGAAQEERRNASSAKIVIDRAELERLDAATVGELLRQLPGVNLGNYAPGRHGRAGTADRLMPNIVVDGSALPGGAGVAFRMPADMIEKIEIIKVSTPEFPAGPGGTINLILRDKPAEKAGTWRAGLVQNDRGMGGRYGGTYGDREGEAGLILIGFGDTRAIADDARISRQTFGGGARTGYDLENDRETGRDDGIHAMARWTRDLGDGARLVLSPLLVGRMSDRLSETLYRSYADPVLATGLAATGTTRDAANDQLALGRLSFDYKRRQPGKGETSAVFNLQGRTSTTDRLRDDYDAAGVLTGATRQRDTSAEQGFTFRGKRSLPLADGTHLVTLGLDTNAKTANDDRRSWNGGVPVALGAQASADSYEREFALWAQDEWSFAGNHVVTPGLRASASARGTKDATGFKVEDDSVSWLPSVSWLWQATPQWNLRASVARSEKLPGVSDLSPVVRTATGTNTLTNPDTAGNPALRRETTDTLQFGIEHFLPQQRGNAGLNVFLRDISDKVERRVAFSGGRYVETPVNFKSASEFSVVADFKWKLVSLPALTLRGNASANRLTLDDPAALVGSEPTRYAGAFGADYEVKPWRTTFGGNVAYSSDFVREANPDTTQTTVARTQLDLYTLTKFNPKLSLRVSVDNVTGTPSGSDYVEAPGGTTSLIESGRTRGVRVFNVSLEGKF